MQFGSDFQRLLQKIFQADSKWDLFFLNKGNIYDGFYQGWMQAQGLAQMGLVMPLLTDIENL